MGMMPPRCGHQKRILPADEELSNSMRTHIDSPRIFISVAEQSADEHAASLIEAFQKIVPGARFAGLAGPAMQAAGCECIHDLTKESAMALAALRRIPEVWGVLQDLKRRLRRIGPQARRLPFDAAVVVDSPALNLPVAKILRRRGIPVLYYIATQTWAWGPRRWRNARLKKRVDRLACLWPFEQPYFRAAGIPATFVGHPSFDRLLKVKVESHRIKDLRGEAAPVVTLLPGSRRHVVEEVFPGQLAVASALAARFPRSRFLTVAAGGDIKTLVESHIRQAPRGTARLSEVPVLCGASDRAAAIRAADLVLVASGTVTLEVAYHGTPMIVMYNAGRWPYLLLGRWLITTKFLSIPNILACRLVVPEFMPYYRSTDPIVACASEWLSTPETLARVRRELAETIKPLVKPGAAANTARELAALLERV